MSLPHVNGEAACALCTAQGKSQTYVQWGRSDSCSNGHKLLYKGLVMAEKHTAAHASEFICVDRDRRAARSAHVGDSNGDLYPAETHGGELSPMDTQEYPNGREIGCAVCAP
jgi:hypothetical protein